MRIRQHIPTSQLIDETGVLVRPGWLLAGLCLAGAAKAIEPPFEVFYPPTAAPFGAGWSLAHFLSSSWAAILVVFMLAGGLLGDRYGRRRVLMWSLGIMLLANFALLLPIDTLWHVLWRIVATISAGIVLPLTLAPLYIFFAGRQRATAFSIYLTTTAVAGLLAAYQGSLITRFLDWNGVYLLPGLLTVAAIFLIRRSLPESRTANPRLSKPLFYTGWAILVLGITYTLFELFFGREWLNLVLLVFAFILVVGIGLLFWWKHKTPGRSLPITTIHTRYVTILIICGVIVQIALIGFYSLTYNYFRVAQNLDFFQTLLSMSPILLGMLGAIFLIARLWGYQQIRRIIAAGFLMVSFAMICMAFLTKYPYWVQIIPLALFGISIIATKTVWTNSFFQILIDRYIGLNAGMTSATLLVGGALGSGLSTELLALFGQGAFIRQSKSLILSEGTLKNIFNSITAVLSAGEEAGIENLAATVSSEMYSLYIDAYIIAYTAAVLVIALLCLLAAILIFWGIRSALKYKPDDLPLND